MGRTSVRARYTHSPYNVHMADKETVEPGSPTEVAAGLDSNRAVRVSLTLKPETRQRLDQAKLEQGIEMNLSAIADAAINRELDERLTNPVMAKVVERLRASRDRRRGAPFQAGYKEGRRWVQEDASWMEVCRYGLLAEEDVKVMAMESHGSFSDGSFEGRFRVAPSDYPSAPAFPYWDDLDGAVELERRPWVCAEYWRGWVVAVGDLFDVLKDELGVEGVDSELGVDHVVLAPNPGDIPF